MQTFGHRGLTLAGRADKRQVGYRECIPSYSFSFFHVCLLSTKRQAAVCRQRGKHLLQFSQKVQKDGLEGEVGGGKLLKTAWVQPCLLLSKAQRGLVEGLVIVVQGERSCLCCVSR